MSSQRSTTGSDGERAGASPDGLPPLREVIRGAGLSADKSLGQNFILDFNLTRRIARSPSSAGGSDPSAGPLTGRTVIEIGPGPGGLTRALFLEGAAYVIAIERDERFRPALEAIEKHYPGRLQLVFADALEVDWHRLVAQKEGRPIIIANLPYNVATLLLIGWLETEPWPPWYLQMTLMFQKEVADRIMAEPGSKAYGRLSVIAQWRCQVETVLQLKPEAFVPPPKVASSVVEFIPRQQLDPPCDVRAIGKVTAAAFGQRRKMLRQSLKALTPFPELLLQRTGIDPQRRGETLSVAEFASLAAALTGIASQVGDAGAD